MGEERPGDKGKPVFHQCFTGSVNSYRGLLPYLDGAGCRMGIWHTKKVIRAGLECWYGFWAEIIPGFPHRASYDSKMEKKNPHQNSRERKNCSCFFLNFFYLVHYVNSSWVLTKLYILTYDSQKSREQHSATQVSDGPGISCYGTTSAEEHRNSILAVWSLYGSSCKKGTVEY